MRRIVVMHDAEILIELFDKTGSFNDTGEYQLLICLLNERIIIDDNRARHLQKKNTLKIHLKFY